MSAYTTLYVTRSKAKEKLMQFVFGEISDEQLQDLMDMLLRDRLYNTIIVPDSDERNDDVYV